MATRRLMTRSTIAAIAAAAMSMALGRGAVAEPAAPRKLPKHDHMFTIPCNTDPQDYHLDSVDPVTGVFTTIGGTTDIEGSTCAYGMAYDHKRKRSYFITGNTTTGNWPLML